MFYFYFIFESVANVKAISIVQFGECIDIGVINSIWRRSDYVVCIANSSRQWMDRHSDYFGLKWW